MAFGETGNMDTTTTTDRRSNEGASARAATVASAAPAARATSAAARRGRRRAAVLAIAAAVGLGALGTAQAARFGVRVVDGSGGPVAGASVCVGLEGNYRQFGTAFTDADGRAALVEVPNIPFVVTVSKTRFTGTRLQQPARGYDLVREVTLAEGLPGPRCKGGSSMVAAPPLIDVRGVDVSDDVAATTLRPRVTGEPSEYRLALDESFGGAGWQRFDDAIVVPSALAGEPSVYLQLRRYSGDERGWLEARSNVVTVYLPAR